MTSEPERSRIWRDGAVQIGWPPEMFWRMFEATGSIWAYLAYRRSVTVAEFPVTISLN